MDISPGHLAHYCAFLPFCTNTQAILQFFLRQNHLNVRNAFRLSLFTKTWQNNRLNLGPKMLIITNNNSISSISKVSYCREFICRRAAYHTAHIMDTVIFWLNHWPGIWSSLDWEGSSNCSSSQRPCNWLWFQLLQGVINRHYGMMLVTIPDGCRKLSGHQHSVGSVPIQHPFYTELNKIQKILKWCLFRMSI